MADLIDRQEALDAMAKAMPNLTTPDGSGEFDRDIYIADEAFVDCMQIINELPSAQPAWIPCSERMPDELAEVNITWVNTDPEPYYDFIKGKPFTGTAVYFKGKWFWYSSVCKDYLAEYGFSPNDEMDDAIKVIAWRELPEPYKGDTNEQNNENCL